MRKTLVWAAVVLLAGCHHKTIEGPASTIRMNDPQRTVQLVSGFYDLEANSWRWTARRFVVVLGAPKGSDTKGATLITHIYIPDDQIAKLGPMTLHVRVDNMDLREQTFTRGGNYAFQRSTPPEALRSDITPVVFELDKALAPVLADGRELGLVCTDVGLVAR